jgi:hypothetical protein
VRILIQRRTSGRRQGRRCVKLTKRNRKRRKCTLYVRAGELRRPGVQGANTTAFSCRIGRKALKPGRYRATLTAADAAGNVSSPRRLSFRVVRR